VGELNLTAAHALPLLELLDRDGQVRQSHRIASWPVSIGRALDNDLPLSDPHVAPYHLRIDHTEGSLVLQVLDTDNGVQLERRRLRRDEQHVLADTAGPAEFTLGRTRLRLRLPTQAVGAELPLAAAATRARRFGPTLAAGALVLGGLTFNTWIESDPDTFARALGAMLMSTTVATTVWCGLWALLSRIFTRQSHFGWHLKVFLFACVAWLIVALVPDTIAFVMSWPSVSDFGFVLAYAVVAAALYHHLLAVEPARPRLLRTVAMVALVSAVGLSLWLNHQRSDRFGAELYMSHLFPPALRLARPVTVDRFVDRLTPLQARLDRKAKEKATDDGASGGSDEE
jgi:predicted secreted protein